MLYSISVPFLYNQIGVKLCMFMQINSFEMELSVPSLASDGGAQTCRAVFIRAPAIIDVGSSVEVLAECPLAPKQAVDLPEQVTISLTQLMPKFSVWASFHRQYSTLFSTANTYNHEDC